MTVDTGDLDGIEMVEPDALESYEAATAEEQSHWEFESGKILVVDDGAENRELIKIVLKDTGLTVESAENGKVGSDKALQEDFDLILMDMQMPIMDGYAATKRLREEGVTVPIYALTANAMKGFEKECLAVGCTGFLTKPVDIDLLLSTIGELLGGQRTTIIPDLPTEEANEVVSNTGASPLTSSLPMDVPEFVEVVETFVGRLNEELPAMREAIDAGDFANLARKAHWLKGSGGTVGFQILTDRALKLEEHAKNSNLEAATSLLAEIESLSKRIQVPPSTDDVEEAAGDTVAVAT